MSSIPLIGAIVAGAAFGVNSTIKRFQGYKNIWSSDDSTGTKIVKSIGNFLWHVSPLGMIVDAIDTVGGWVKKIFGIENKKDKQTNGSASPNGKVNIGDIVINSPDKPASATKKVQQQTPQKKKWYESKFWF